MRITFIHLVGLWWFLALFLGTFQLYGMSKIWWIGPLGLFIAALCFYLHDLLAHYRATKPAQVILFVYALVNLIPLILQLAGMKEPGLDNIVAAGIALGLLHYCRNL